MFELDVVIKLFHRVVYIIWFTTLPLSGDNTYGMNV